MEEVKLSLCADGMILYTAKPLYDNMSIRTQEFGRGTGCDINTQKSIALLHINNFVTEKNVQDKSTNYSFKTCYMFCNLVKN